VRRGLALRAAVVVALAGSVAKLAGARPAPRPAQDADAQSAERSWALPRDEPELPTGPGRSAFYAACATCHSTRYVTDQPGFSREVWIAEVEKMKKAYGAEIAPDKAEEIVGYLVSVNGPR
jgi:sulfite dehydrogenase (cytochrome) subunit B